PRPPLLPYTTLFRSSVRTEAAPFEPVTAVESAAGDHTLGAVPLTPSQFRLILALAEPTLRRSGTGLSELPTNAAVARRLGWSARSEEHTSELQSREN